MVDQKTIDAIIALKRVFNDIGSTVMLFSELEKSLQEREVALNSVKSLLNTNLVQSVFNTSSGGNSIKSLLELSIHVLEQSISDQKTSNLMIQALVLNLLEIQNKPNTLDNSKLINDKDRAALDWLDKYIRHGPKDEGL
jgi:hypothetical protein